MRNLIFITIFLFTISAVSAQTSGYLGKSTIIRYDFLTSYAIKPTPKLYYNKINETSSDLSLISEMNKMHEVSVEHVIARAKSLIGKVYLYNTATNYEDPFNYDRKLLLLKNFGVGLTYRKYNQNKGGLAPLGNYNEIGMTIIKGKATYQDTLYSVFTTPLLSYGSGVQRILFNRLPLEYGFRIGLLFDPRVFIDEPTGLKRLASGALINFNIGVGYLLF